MANFNIHKCDETDLKEYLPNITQAISNKTGLLDATASEHALMAHLQRAMIVSLSVIAPQNNVGYIVFSQDAKSGLRLQFAIASEVAISSYTMTGSVLPDGFHLNLLNRVTKNC